MKKFVTTGRRFRFVNSGTEATMTAVRLARGATKRNKIIIFNGCYHGHADPFLVQAGSGMLTHGVASSLGVCQSVASDTICLDFNDAAGVERAFSQYGDSIAGVIFECVGGNMNFILPEQSFLDAIRDCCARYKSLMILDEVMTGFRVAPGGAASLYKLAPDITCYGKVIGGGLPIGCLTGKDEILDLLAPLGGVYQAGTLSGNPMVMSAGVATLTELKKKRYQALDACSQRLGVMLNTALAKKGIAHCYYHLGGMFGLHLGIESAKNLDEVKRGDAKLFARFHQGLRKRGVLFAPSPFEAGFVSFRHTPAVMARVEEAISLTVKRL